MSSHKRKRVDREVSVSNDEAKESTSSTAVSSSSSSTPSSVESSSLSSSLSSITVPVYEKEAADRELEDEKQLIAQSESNKDWFKVPIDLRGVMMFMICQHSNCITTVEEIQNINMDNPSVYSSKFVWIANSEMQKQMKPPFRLISIQPAWHLQFTPVGGLHDLVPRKDVWKNEPPTDTKLYHQLESLMRSHRELNEILPHIIINMILLCLQPWTQTIAYMMDADNTVYPMLLSDYKEYRKREPLYLWAQDDEKKLFPVSELDHIRLLQMEFESGSANARSQYLNAIMLPADNMKTSIPIQPRVCYGTNRFGHTIYFVRLLFDQKN
jgi:hypothetical protein